MAGLQSFSSSNNERQTVPKVDYQHVRDKELKKKYISEPYLKDRHLGGTTVVQTCISEVMKGSHL